MGRQGGAVDVPGKARRGGPDFLLVGRIGENCPHRSRQRGRVARDDAAGEAYDKVARLLGLGYPGGPVIDQIAAKVAASGSTASDKDALNFGPIKIKGNPYDFSFSGIKTAVLYYVRAHPELEGA